MDTFARDPIDAAARPEPMRWISGSSDQGTCTCAIPRRHSEAATSRCSTSSELQEGPPRDPRRDGHRGGCHAHRRQHRSPAPGWTRGRTPAQTHEGALGTTVTVGSV